MRVYLFDIDGTLVSSGGAGKAAMEAALAATFGVAAASNGVPYSGRTDRSITRDLFRVHGIAESPDNWRRFLTAYLDRLPDTLANHVGRVMPGVVPLLEHLRTVPDAVLGLLTGNVREGARLKLGHYQLFDYFAFGGFGDQHHERDDVAREALRAALGHVGREVASDRVWVIGDTPLDVRCARAIGARVVAVRTGGHAHEELADAGPDLLVTDLSDRDALRDLWEPV